jgi:hypothetical protein
MNADKVSATFDTIMSRSFPDGLAIVQNALDLVSA